MSASCRELTGLSRPAATGPQLRRSRNELCFWPLEPGQPERRKKLPGRGVTVVAAVSEELPRLASAARNGTAVAGRPAPPGKVAVRAALTVRRKHKEDLKEAVAGHLDALWDMVGWGVVLELISTKIHPMRLMRAADAVSRGTDSGSTKKVFASKKLAERKRGTKKVSGRQKECSMERQLERRGPYTHQQANGNLEEEVSVNEVTNQELSLLVPPGFKAICNGQSFLDGGKVDERPIQLHIQNAGSSQSTMDHTILRSCSVVGTSLHPTFPSCQISGERVPFVKASPIEPLEVFQKVPQQPHFLPLQQFMPELREGMAIGLMVTYATLVESVKKSCISDGIDLIERKINALAHLEENGFDVKPWQQSLNKLLPGKEFAVSHKCALLDEKEGATTPITFKPA